MTEIVLYAAESVALNWLSLWSQPIWTDVVLQGPVQLSGLASLFRFCALDNRDDLPQWCLATDSSPGI